MEDKKLNIKCEHGNDCKRFNTIYCVDCKNNLLKDFYEEIEKEDEDEGEEDEEDEEVTEEEEDEKEELSRQVAKHPDFKENAEENDIEFIKKFFPKIIEEWDDTAIDEIAESARDITNNNLSQDEDDEWITDEDKEEYGRKVAQHQDFPKFIQNHTTRKMFIRKYFPEIYKKIDPWGMNEISNMSKFIYESEVKNKK